MHVNIPRRVMVLFLAVLSLLTLGIVAPSSASANVYDEIYACHDNGQGGSEYNTGDCDGTWWHNNTLRRTIRIAFQGVTHAKASHYNNTPLTYLSSLDGSQKVLRFYCTYKGGTTSGNQGTITLGGSNPYNWSRPSGWNPCVGYDVGIKVTVQGWYGGKTMWTTVYANTDNYQFAQRGYQCTYPDYCG